jgi:hypothetical protein
VGLFGESTEELARREIEAKKRYVVKHQGEPVNKNIDDIQEKDNRKKIIRTNNKIILFSFAVPIVIIIIMVVYSVWIYPAYNDGVTLEQYNKIKIGMTYDEVVRITGKDGKLFVSDSTGLGESQTYTWSSGYVLSGATIDFFNGKVTFKTQSGLK